jgi:hypothetical protein
MTSRTRTTALTTALTAALTAAPTAALAGGPLPTLGGPVAPASAATASPRAARTDLTLAVSGCNGCRLRLTQALAGRPEVWQSRSRTVRNGSAAWTIPTSRTHGLSITVRAPWDGGIGAVPTVVFRYAGQRVGDPVTDVVARSKRRASACWAGTAAHRVTIAVTVVHAPATNPPGDPIRTPRAFTSTTRRWERPMEHVWHGIAGTQDATYCG